MGEPQNIKRFRVNPVEVAIFTIVSLIFLNSVYSLFNDRNSFQPVALSPMAANPTQGVGAGRSPASTGTGVKSFQNVIVSCDKPMEIENSAAKVRLEGTLCGTTVAEDAKKLLKTQIVNNANKYTATVFADVSKRRFSTDYIPLTAGKNPIRLEFTYKDGKLVSQDLTIVKQ